MPVYLYYQLELVAIRQSRANFDQLDSKLREAETELSLFHSELIAMNEIKNSYSILQARLNQSEGISAELEAKLVAVETERTMLVDANKERQKRHNEQIDDFEARIAKAHQETHFFRDEMSNSHKKIAELENEIKLLQEQNRARNVRDSVLSDMETKIINLQSDKKMLEATSSVWQDRCKRAEEQIAILKKELDGELSKVHFLEQQVSQLKISVASAHNVASENSILCIEKEKLRKQSKEIDSERKMMALEREIFERQQVDVGIEKDALPIINKQLKSHLNILDAPKNYEYPNPLSPKLLANKSPFSKIGSNSKVHDPYIQERLKNIEEQCSTFEKTIEKNKFIS